MHESWKCNGSDHSTALAIEYGTGPSSEKAIMISCDVAGISDGARDVHLKFKG